MENAPDRTTNYQVERSNEQSPNRKNVRVGPRAQTSEKTTNNRATELDMCMDGRLDGQLERAGQPRTSSRRGRVGPPAVARRGSVRAAKNRRQAQKAGSNAHDARAETQTVTSSTHARHK